MGRPLIVPLGASAAALLAAVPLVMALANRSAPLVVGLSALAMMACMLAEGGGRSFWVTLSKARSSPLTLAGLVFVALAVASYAWSVDRDQTLRAMGEAALPLVAGLILLAWLPRLAPPWLAGLCAACVIAAAAICLYDLSFGMRMRAALHLRAKAFEYNRPVLTQLVLFWPLCAAAFGAASGGGRPGWVKALSWIALAATTAAIWRSMSGTAMSAQCVSVAVALVAWRWPRLALGLAAVAISAAFLLAFAVGDMAWHLLPGRFYGATAWMHAADRVEIWRSYGAAMLVHPIFGAGFGSSVTMGDTSVVGDVASEFRRMLSVGHPHNGFLQTGVELGFVGCLVALAIALIMLWRWRDLRGVALASRLGLFAMVAATMLVGHGAWQAWWIAIVFAGAALIATFAPSGASMRERQ